MDLPFGVGSNGDGKLDDLFVGTFLADSRSVVGWFPTFGAGKLTGALRDFEAFPQARKLVVGAGLTIAAHGVWSPMRGDGKLSENVGKRETDSGNLAPCRRAVLPLKLEFPIGDGIDLEVGLGRAVGQGSVSDGFPFRGVQGANVCHPLPKGNTMGNPDDLVFDNSKMVGIDDLTRLALAHGSYRFGGKDDGS